MGFISTAIISLLEKELAGQAPEVEAFILNLLETIAGDIVAYVEKKISSTNPVVTSIGDQNG